MFNSIKEIKQELSDYINIWAPEILKLQLRFPDAILQYRIHIKLQGCNLPEAYFEDLSDCIKRMEDN